MLALIGVRICEKGLDLIKLLRLLLGRIVEATYHLASNSCLRFAGVELLICG